MKTAQIIAEHAERSTDPKSVNAPKRKMHPNSLANLVKPWEPGQSGNPGGRRPDVAREISRAAFENNREAIYKAVAAKLLAGDAYAFSVHADRAYDKLKQVNVHQGDEEGGPVRTSITVRFVEPSDK